MEDVAPRVRAEPRLMSRAGPGGLFGVQARAPDKDRPPEQSLRVEEDVDLTVGIGLHVPAAGTAHHACETLELRCA
jgi:hypothetical protein